MLSNSSFIGIVISFFSLYLIVGNILRSTPTLLNAFIFMFISPHFIPYLPSYQHFFSELQPLPQLSLRSMTLSVQCHLATRRCIQKFLSEVFICRSTLCVCNFLFVLNASLAIGILALTYFKHSCPHLLISLNIYSCLTHVSIYFPMLFLYLYVIIVIKKHDSNNNVSKRWKTSSCESLCYTQSDYTKIRAPN